MHLLSALLSGGSIIDLDGTFFIQLALFFVAFFVLRSFVFKPMMALFDAREQAIDGAKGEAKELVRDAKRKADEFDTQLRGVKLSAGDERERLRQDGARLERAILEKVRVETQSTLEGARRKMDEEARTIRVEMASTVPNLAREIATKLLGREIL